ncbi:NAD(+)/NADH kinase [bacterium]|nr:NAD(+)/NADH kinase [bacterium]
MSDFQSILIAQRKDKRRVDTVREIVSILSAFCEKHTIEYFIDVVPPTKTPSLVIAVGGDGTFLNASRDAITYNVPILGINAGDLGFLAEIKISEIEEELEDILTNKREIQERMVMRASLKKGGIKDSFLVVNEMMMMRDLDGPMMNYEISSRHQKLPDYRCDAIIVATPTGSTGYNLSVNGPILFPTEDSFILNAMAPHALTHRPIVMPSNRNLEIRIKGSGGGTLIIDGRQITTVAPGDEVEVTRADEKLLFISSSHRTFFDILAEKLHLGKRM